MDTKNQPLNSVFHALSKYSLGDLRDSENKSTGNFVLLENNKPKICPFQQRKTVVVPATANKNTKIKRNSEQHCLCETGCAKSQLLRNDENEAFLRITCGTPTIFKLDGVNIGPPTNQAPAQEIVKKSKPRPAFKPMPRAVPVKKAVSKKK